MAIQPERLDLNFWRKSPYIHIFREVRPEYLDNLRSIAAVFVLGRVLTPEELGSMAELRMGILGEGDFNERFPDFRYRFDRTESLFHESLHSRTNWASLSYDRVLTQGSMAVLKVVDLPHYRPLLPE